MGRIVDLLEEEPHQSWPARLGESIWQLGRSTALMSVIAVAVVVVPCMLDEAWRNQLISMLPPQVRAYLAQHAGKPHTDVRPIDALGDLGPGFSVGATKAQVLAVQGIPTRREATVWYYGKSQLIFSEGGRVESWVVSPADPLRIAP